MLDAKGEVLLGIDVLVVGIQMYAGAIVFGEEEVGRQSLFLAQSYVVALVHLETLVSDDGVEVGEVDAERVVSHQRPQSYTHTERVFVVVDIGSQVRPVFEERAVDQRPEGIHGIILEVLHLGIVAES